MPTNPYMTDKERLTALEVKFDQYLTAQAERDKKDLERDTKLDSLLELRDKGLGAFWLISALIGTGLLGLVITAVGWFKS